MKKMFALLSAWFCLGARVCAGCAHCGPPPRQRRPGSSAGCRGSRTVGFTTVVKIAGINWFNRMETGVVAWGKEKGVNASEVGPAQADAAQQIPIIEDLIAKKVDALCVIPMDPAQLDPVLKKAMDAGIIVITHEASNQKEMHYDIEAFDNTAFGAGLMDRLAAGMGEEVKYAVFVGNLGSDHNEWVDMAHCNRRRSTRR
jgi:simple sugar transport system substrate-binding protein